MTDASIARRLHGFDILRIVSMVAILAFHSNETVFFKDAPPLDSGPLFSFLKMYAKIFAISGFTIAAFSSFLYAIREPAARVWYRLFMLLAAGIAVLAWLAGEGAYLFIFEWDIYSYLLFTLAVLFIVRKSPAAIRALGIIGFILLTIPVWDLVPLFKFENRLWMQALVGACGTSGGGGWPILPWSGLMWMFYALGREWILNKPLRERLQRKMRIGEVSMIILVLAGSLPLLGAYRVTPWGPGFGCFVFRQPPLIFWGHFIWVLIFMRISLVADVNEWLSRKRWARWISGLEWSRHFGRCYLLHLLYLGLGSGLASAYTEHPWLFDIYVAGNIPVCEMVARLIERVFKKAKS